MVVVSVSIFLTGPIFMLVAVWLFFEVLHWLLQLLLFSAMTGL